MSMLSQTAGMWLIQINGIPLVAAVQAQLTEAVYRDHVNQPSSLSLHFVQAGETLTASLGATLGSIVTAQVISTTTGPSGSLLFTGRLAAVEYEGDATGTTVVLRCYDAAHDMQRVRNNATYPFMTYGEVVALVAAKYGLIPEITEPGPLHSVVSQQGETDWELLVRMASELNCVVRVDAMRTLHFGPPTSPMEAPPVAVVGPMAMLPGQLCNGINVLRLRATATSSEQVSSVQVRAWDSALGAPVIGESPVANPYAASLAGIADALAGLLGSTAADPFTVTGVPVDDEASAESLARYVAGQIGGSQTEIEADTFGDAGIKAGCAISLGGVGPEIDGRYVVSGTEHHYSAGSGYRTTVHVTGANTRTAWALGHQPGPGASNRIPGVLPGIVNDIADIEQAARVKVSLPTLGDAFVTDWAPVAYPGAGEAQGVIWHPEVGDQVLVVFEQGDIRRPYVLAGIYQREAPRALPAPETVDPTSGGVTKRVLKSRLGHHLTFSDVAEEAQVTLASGAGLSIQLSDVDATVTITGTGDVKIVSEGQVSIQGAAISLQADGEVSISAGGALSLSGEGSVEVSGSDVNVSGEGAVEVSGATVMLG